jgi:putative transposase
MDEVEIALRREAARRRLAGESPRAIARDLGRTRQWVAKWAARYDPHDPGWAEGLSRAPKRVANRTAAGVAAQVLEVRKRLEANPWAQVGAPAIAWELSKLGTVVPPERTIEEILERAGATKRQRPGRRASKGIPYPAPAARRAGEVVQVDFVGPRHLDGGVRFHALNQIDVASHHAGIEIIEDRSDRTVLVALHALWGRHGVPGRIQFDNGGPFVAPTGLGEVVRVCLRQGTTPVFVPPREPWRNGTIEHFNDTFDKRFFRQERFADVEALTERAGAFERFHNAQHRYSATRGHAPDQTRASKPRTPIALAELPAGWPAQGKVEFIRFIRSDHKLRILGRAIQVPDGSAYQYVTATLDLALTADDEHNVLISNDQGELLTTGRLPTPAR